MADELIDILNENGTNSNRVALKSEAHRSGLWHASVHIWMYTKNKEVLVQKRAANKDTYPNLWDISVAGHIGEGEQPRQAAIREVAEELGITIMSEALKAIGVHKASKKPTSQIIDNEFNHIFCCEFLYDIATLKLQQEEVAGVKLIPLAQLEEALITKKSTNYVPHSTSYYKTIVSALKSLF